jgi:hypothetical protein
MPSHRARIHESRPDVQAPLHPKGEAALRGTTFIPRASGRPAGPKPSAAHRAVSGAPAGFYGGALIISGAGAAGDPSLGGDVRLARPGELSPTPPLARDAAETYSSPSLRWYAAYYTTGSDRHGNDLAVSGRLRSGEASRTRTPGGSPPRDPMPRRSAAADAPRRSSHRSRRRARRPRVRGRTRTPALR